MMFASETALGCVSRHSTLPFIQCPSLHAPATRTLSRAGTDFRSQYTPLNTNIASNFQISNMPGGPDLSIEVRTACVVLRYATGMQHAEIARRLELKPGTVRTTCTRVQKKAGSTNLLELLKHCGTLPRTGRPPAPGAKPTKKRRAALKKQKAVVPVAGPPRPEEAQVATTSASQPDDSASFLLSKASGNSDMDFATPSGTFVDPTITLLTQHNNHGFQISNPMPYQGPFAPNN
jgi:hypothetical protein